MHPSALFALTEAELALHAETPREYPWSHDTREDDQEGVGGDVGETEGDEAPAPTKDDGSAPSVDPDDLGENGRRRRKRASRQRPRRRRGARRFGSRSSLAA